MIEAIKFIHILLTLGLLGSVVYCFTATNSRKSVSLINHKIILSLVLFVMITGTLLVYPRHYTFHTPWIRAAYLFLAVFSVGIVWLLKKHNKKKMVASSKERFFYFIGYFFLMVILIFIVHDAVTKSTLF